MSLPNVINFHITEACNYECVYCFARFKANGEYELKEWLEVTDKFSNYFKDNNLDGRINVAGGEPMIAPYFFDLVDYIYKKGIEVSIITNASKLNKESIDSLIGKVSTIGISIDSLDYNKNLEIGRSQGSQTFDYNKLVESLRYIKANNINLKVNTVVSKLNLDEDITKLYNDIPFDRIKLLQVRVNEGSNEFAKEYEISDEEFQLYVDKIKVHVKKNLVIENNTDMEDSYIIIDPRGGMVGNNDNKHTLVGNVLEEDIKELINKSNYKHHRFIKRY